MTDFFCCNNPSSVTSKGDYVSNSHLGSYSFLYLDSYSGYSNLHIVPLARLYITCLIVVATGIFLSNYKSLKMTNVEIGQIKH